MASCDISTPTVTTKDGREIEAPLYTALKKMVNVINARNLYNGITSEEFKNESFYLDMSLDGNAFDEYGQPTIEALLKYTDFNKAIDLVNYSESVSQDLFGDKIEIKNTQDLISSLVKVRDWNNDNKYYKAILIKNPDGSYGLQVVKNTIKASNLVHNIDLYLSNIENINIEDGKKDLFEFLIDNYNVTGPNSKIDPQAVITKLKEAKNHNLEYSDFTKILPSLSVYSNKIGLNVTKVIADNVDYMLNYLKQQGLVSNRPDDLLRADIEKNPKFYAGIIKNHLLYMAYKDSALGDLVMGVSKDSKYVATLIERLNKNLTEDLNKITVPEKKEDSEFSPEVPVFGLNVEYFSKINREAITNETDIVKRLIYLEKDIYHRMEKVTSKSEAKQLRSKTKALEKLIDKGDVYSGLVDYINSTTQYLKELQKKINKDDPLNRQAKNLKILLDKCNEYNNVVEYFNEYIESNLFKEDFEIYLNGILNENNIDKKITELTQDELEEYININDDLKKYQDVFEQYYSGNIEMKGFDTLSTTISKFQTNLKKYAVDLTADFLEQYQTSDGSVIAFGKNKGQKVDIKALLQKADEDINVYNKLFSAMADCPDTIFRLTDKAMKTQKGKARLETQDLAREIKKEALLLEKSGIRDFSWLYDRNSDGTKSGMYVTKFTNPKAYAEIMADSRKKRFYEFFMKTKNELDMMYPDNLMSGTEAKIIGIRKDRLERFKSVKNIKQAGKQLIEGIKDNYMERSDDEDIQGYSELFTDASGNEFKMLPVYYNNFDMSEADNMSEDAVSTLISYSAKAIEYKHLNDLIDLIEVEKIALKERKIPSTDGKLKVLNLFNRAAYRMGDSSKEDNVVYHKDEGTSNLYKMFDSWVDMQFYGRWRQREGTIGDTKISTAKAVDMLNKKTAIASMSLNLLNGISNVMTGISQTRIETIVGSLGKGYVGVKDMAKADTTYMAELPKFMAEFGNRVKTSKLALFSEMLNVSQEYESDITETQWARDNKAKRLLSSDSALSFIQNSGEHYMAHRMAIAVAVHTKLKDSNGNEKTLWDALKPEYLQEDGTYGSVNKGLGARLTLDGSYTLNGKEFKFEGEDLYKLERKITGINQKIHGIYNKQDANIIQRYSIGRLVYMFRKWIPAAIDKRFMNSQYNYDTNEWKEGYYRTTFDFLKQLWHEREGLKLNTIVKFKGLNEEQKANILRALTESLIFFTTVLLGKAIIPPDDDKEKQSWATNMLHYQLTRLTSELAALTPVSIPNINQNMLSEALKLFKSPIAAANTMQDSYSILGLLNPYCWFEDVKSGKYKDHSKAYKIIMSNRFWNPLGTLYYKNSHPEAFIGWYK